MSQAAQLAVLDEILDGMAGAIRDNSDDRLNWMPPADDTNSIAALVRHVCGSLDSWLARAVGETVERNREAEFQYRGDAAQLLALLEQTRLEARRRLARLESVDLREEVPIRRTLPHPHESTATRAWCVEHALVHAAEHWGQIQLTAQLYPAYGPGHEPTV